MQPYFVLQGNICALLAAKDHVNVFLYDGGDRARPRGHHHGRSRQPDRAHGRRSARARRSTGAALLAMFRQIIANNRAGGWRKLKAR